MNVEWWGGEQSSPPADYKSAIPACQVQLGAAMSAAAWMGLFAQLPPAALFTRRARRCALPGH